MKIRFIVLSFAIVIASNTTILAQSTYDMDKNHCKLGFRVKHMGISHVEGNFKAFEAKLESKKEDFTDAKIEMTAETNSINTGVEMRDNDLRSVNWLNAALYPTIKFKSTSFKKINGNNYSLSGDITIHGITKPITFDVTYNGKALNLKTQKNSVGFTVSGKLNRQDFGVGSSAFAKTAADEVYVTSNVEFIETVSSVYIGK